MAFPHFSFLGPVLVFCSRRLGGRLSLCTVVLLSNFLTGKATEGDSRVLFLSPHCAIASIGDPGMVLLEEIGFIPYSITERIHCRD